MEMDSYTRLPSDTELESAEKAVADENQDNPHDSDLGNAERFVDQHLDRIRYCPQFKAWYVWSPPIWRKDETGEVMRLAGETVKSIYGEIASLTDSQDRREKGHFAIRSESERSLKAMVNLAASDPRIIFVPDQLDQYPHLLATPLGIIDLRTGDPNPYPSHEVKRLNITRATRVAPWPFDRECPTFMSCLERWTEGKPELKDFLQVAVGYTLTAEIGAEVMFFVYGPTRTGKSKLITAIQYALGDLATSINPDVLMRGRNRAGQADPDIAKLPGKRMAVTIETEDNQRLAEAKVKSLIGGDILSTRALYGNPFDFVNRAKIWLASNHKPEFSGNQAIWERLIVIPFENTIPFEDRDQYLTEKLQGEAPGILAWAIEGARRFYVEGLKPPKVCLTAAREYREEMDSVERWIGERCETDPDYREPYADLRRDYEEFCRDEDLFALSKPQFNAALKDKGFHPIRTGKARLREGIRLRNQGHFGGDTSDSN